jgi:CheY-like chemotaxis protein
LHATQGEEALAHAETDIIVRMDTNVPHGRSGTNDGLILLAEDNPHMVEFFIGMMRAEGIENEVVVARDGIEALDYLFGTGEHADMDTIVMPSVVVLDIGMPRMDGLEALRRIRADERTELLPVVMLSASDGISDVTRAYRLGANGFVCKVHDTLPFHELVPHLVRYWLFANKACLPD